MKIETARSYDIVKQDKIQGRFLVDRLWPRGIKKEALQLDLWVRELSPSDDLRKWYGHDPRKWHAFRKKYFEELNSKPEDIASFLNTIKKYKKITLIYSSTEKDINNAVALKEYLLKALEAGV